MKIALNISQVLIALYTITGALYMMGNYDVLATSQAFSTLPSPFWLGLGITQILLAVILIVALFYKPAQAHSKSTALLLAGLSLVGLILYSAYSGFPDMLWAILPAFLYLGIAHKNKYALYKNLQVS